LKKEAKTFVCLAYALQHGDPHNSKRFLVLFFKDVVLPSFDLGLR
jgi:hypothetical protein